MKTASTPGPAKAGPPGPQPPTTTKPWLVTGLSRSAWFRLRSAGVAPAPLSLPGCRPTWRVADLLRWLEGLPTTSRRAPPKAKARAAD